MKKNAKILGRKRTKHMIKYIAYCRKSTDEKDKQVLSIEAQIAELKEFAKRENLSVSEFITEAKTAKVPGREQFADGTQKNRKRMRLTEFSHGTPIVWPEIRLTAEKLFIFWIPANFLILKFPSFWFETTPQGKFMLSIAFGQSKYYVDNLKRECKTRKSPKTSKWCLAK